MATGCLARGKEYGKGNSEDYKMSVSSYITLIVGPQECGIYWVSHVRSCLSFETSIILQLIYFERGFSVDPHVSGHEFEGIDAGALISNCTACEYIIFSIFQRDA
jgi:hypothetical protein